MIRLKYQSPLQVVEVSDYLQDNQTGYPEGKRDKDLFILPPNEYKFCIAGCRYLFKLSRDIYPEQFWMEIFAYQFGCLIGVTVPPAFVAYNKKTEKPGALIEWFLNDKYSSFIPGGDILQANIERFERKKGKLHNFESVVNILSQSSMKIDKNWMLDFVKMLTFDALIGNSDRHQDNWGLAVAYTDTKIAPAFDNGTSMGHEIREKDFANFNDIVYLKKYIDRGKPHLRWDLNGIRKERPNHQVFLKKIIEYYPQTRDAMRSCLLFTSQMVQGILESLLEFNKPEHIRLTKKRADFMLHLLCARRDHLRSSLVDLVYEQPYEIY